MPRGVDRYDEAQLQGRLWTPELLVPTGILAAWFDADDFNTFTLSDTGAVGISGQAIVEWRDKSRNNRHAQQATSGQRPQYRTLGQSDVTIGAKPTVRFDTTDDNFVIANSAALRSANYFHVVGVRKSSAGTAAETNSMRPLISSTTTAYSLGASTSILLTNETILAIAGADSANNPRLGANAANYTRPPQTPEIAWFHTNNLTTFGQNFGVRINGANLTLNLTNGTFNQSLAPSAASPAITTMSISNNGACIGVCDFSEIIISISTAFRNTALELIEGYLSWKWSVPLRANHPFTNRPPLIGD